MEKDNLHIGFGIMRGMNQAQAQAQFVSNVVDHHMNIQAAIEAPRFTRPNLGGCDVTHRKPRARKRCVTPWRRRDTPSTSPATTPGLVGGGQAVMRDSRSNVNLRRLVAAQGWRRGARTGTLLRAPALTRRRLFRKSLLGGDSHELDA